MQPHDRRRASVGLVVLALGLLAFAAVGCGNTTNNCESTNGSTNTCTIGSGTGSDAPKETSNAEPTTPTGPDTSDRASSQPNVRSGTPGTSPMTYTLTLNNDVAVPIGLSAPTSDEVRDPTLAKDLYYHSLSGEQHIVAQPSNKIATFSTV